MSGFILLGLFCTAIGFVIGSKRIWPYDALQGGYSIVVSIMKYGEVVGEGRRVLPPEGASREFVSIHDANAAIGSGYYALLGWDDPVGSYAVWLLGADGSTVHKWPVNEMSFSGKAEHNQNAPHAMEILNDGSLLVSFDWLGLIARLDTCGNALWTREGFFHHSFSPSADGNIWTWYSKYSSYGQFQDVLKFNPITGEDVARINLGTDIITRTPETALAFSMLPDYPFPPDDVWSSDIFHPNDVEELLPELAPAFPQFEAGDLMLSIRELDMVAIIAPTGELKWYKRGPWLKQHDPDFEPDGRISVFDNSRFRPDSIIMSIDPQTDEVTNALPDLTYPFKSEFRGKHQLLPNGNRLVTIPEQGSAIEVSRTGKVVVEFNNILPGNTQFNEDLMNVKWLPGGYFDTMPSCSGN